MFSHIYRSLIRSRKCPQAYTMLLSLPAADTSFGPPPEYLGARFIRPARRQLADEHRYLVGKAPVPFGSRTGPKPAPDRERGGAAPGLSELPRAMPAAQCPSWGVTSRPPRHWPHHMAVAVQIDGHDEDRFGSKRELAFSAPMSALAGCGHTAARHLPISCEIVTRQAQAPFSTRRTRPSRLDP
jgi:hypothetical protein